MNVILIEGVVKGRPRVPIYSKDGRIFCPREKNWRQRKGIPSGQKLFRRVLIFRELIPFDMEPAKRRIFLGAII